MLSTKIAINENLLELYHYFDSGKRRKLLNLNKIDREFLDPITMYNKYMTQHTGDISADANANVGATKTPHGMISDVMKGPSILLGYNMLINKLETLYSEEEARDLIESIWRGYYYFHDGSGSGMSVPYCFAASTANLMLQGRPYNQLYSKPPTRSDSFIHQTIEFVMDLSQDFVGAIAVGDLLVNLAYYVHNEHGTTWTPLVQKKVENLLQGFVHVVNNPYRPGHQSPFTNVSVFDSYQLDHLFSKQAFPDGKTTFKTIKPVVQNIQQLYLKFIAKKDPATKLPYRFPVTTVNMTIDPKSKKIKDVEFLDLVSELNQEGLFNIYVTDDVGKIASCCRLLSDSEAMLSLRGADSFATGGISLGSTRVVTINLARLALESDGNKKAFLKKLQGRLEGVRKLLYGHRQILKDNIAAGYLKFFKIGWINLDQMFFSTVGIIGLYEVIDIFGMAMPGNGEEFAIEILSMINDATVRWTKEDRLPYNIEQIPGETAAITLAEKDRVYYPSLKYRLYSNQSIPLWIEAPLTDRVRIDGMLNRKYTGGGISHLNISSSVTKEQGKALIEFAANSGLEHFALNPVYTIYTCGHVNLGKDVTCPVCGKGTVQDHLTRVIGYFTPVSSWTAVRRWEFPKREFKGDVVL